MQAENGLGRKCEPNSKQNLEEGSTTTGRCLAFNVSASKRQAINHAPNSNQRFEDVFDSTLRVIKNSTTKVAEPFMAPPTGRMPNGNIFA